MSHRMVRMNKTRNPRIDTTGATPMITRTGTTAEHLLCARIPPRLKTDPMRISASEARIKSRALQGREERSRA